MISDFIKVMIFIFLGILITELMTILDIDINIDLE